MEVEKMFEFEKEEDKMLMLEKMRENHWETETNEESSYEDVKVDFDEMIEELEAIEDDMYPNGRDYDAENFDD